MKKITSIILAFAMALCFLVMQPPAKAMGEEQYAPTWMYTVYYYPTWEEFTNSEDDPCEYDPDPDDGFKLLTIDYYKRGVPHIKGLGYLVSNKDGLMPVTKNKKRDISKNCVGYGYDGEPFSLDKYDDVVLTGAKKDGKIGIRHKDSNLCLYVDKSCVGLERVVKRTCHVYKTASQKHPCGKIKKGTRIMVYKTHGNFAYIGGHWVKFHNTVAP